MARLKRSPKTNRRRKAITVALGVAGALSLATGASAAAAPTGDIPAQKTASVMLAEEEISDVSLSTFYVFDRENAPRSGLQLAARGCGHGCGHGCAARGCARGCGHGGCAVRRACGGCGCAVHRACGGCGGCGGGCCFWIGPVRVC